MSAVADNGFDVTRFDVDRDYYAVLEVPPEASDAQIARAYRRQLRRFHPDTRTSHLPTQQHPSRSAAEDAAAQDAQLALVLTAFAVLRDPDHRAAYDRARRNRAARARPARSPRQRPSTWDSSAREPSTRDPGSYLTDRAETRGAQPPIRVGPVHYQPPPQHGGGR